MSRRHSFSLGLFLLGAIVAVVSSSSPAAADDSQESASSSSPILVVVDLSSSMNDPDGNGKIKVQGAREAFSGLVSDLGASARLGVWTYPDDGSCGAGTLSTRFQPVAGINADSVTAAWDANGNTPTAQALRAAANTVALAGGNTIILISDGESNCNADPCAAAELLATEGINVQFHTVGFDISDQGRTELECIASVTGGTYTDVEDSDELAVAVGALSGVTVSVNVTAEILDDAAGTSYPSARVKISAVVTNSGVRPARDVEVTLRFNGDRRPVLLDGTRRLPILEAGSSHTVSWTFSAPIDCVDYALDYTAIVRVEDGPSDSGAITVPGRSDSVYCLLTLDGNLVILGDSYSSGEGAPPYDSGTNASWNGCRKGQTYGRADRVGDLPDDPPDYEGDDPLRVLACSGAIIHDLLLPHGEFKVASGGPLISSQLNQLVELTDDVDVVVLTISGNDIGFTSVIADCVFGSPCSDEASTSRDTADVAVASLEAPLMRALRIIESTVNSGRESPVQFVLMPYVTILPGEEFPENADDCPIGVKWLQIEVEADEARYLSNLQGNLNTVLNAATYQMALEGRPFHFAGSVSEAFDGHTLCDEEPWGHSVETWYLLTSEERRSESVHPNSDGYRAIWRSLLNDARDWTIKGRDVSVELTVEGGQLCPADDAGNYRILSYGDFLANSQLELQKGECIIVVGGPEDDKPVDDTIGPPPEDFFDFSTPIDWENPDPGVDVVEYDDNYQLSSWIAFSIQSDPELLGVARPDENGSFREILWIPDDLPLGEHTLLAYAQDGSGSIETFSRPVLLVDESTVPFKAALGISLAAMLIGGGLVALGSGRWQRIDDASSQEPDEVVV